MPHQSYSIQHEKFAPLYKQHHAFLYVIFALAVVTLIKLDELIGAEGLRPIGFIGGLLCAYGLLIINLLLAVRWRELSKRSAFIWWIVITVVSYIAFPYWIILTSWLLAIVGLFVRPFMFPLMIIAVLILWYITYRRGRVYRRSNVAQNVFFAMLLCVSYLIGNAGPRAEFTSIDSINTGEQHYFLSVVWGWNFDPDVIHLFECNSFAFACEDIYQGGFEEELFYVDNPGQYNIELDVSDNVIRVLVNDEVWLESEQ